MSLFVVVERGNVEKVILPAATRRLVARGLAMLRGNTLENPSKKHGNIPL